MKKKSYNIGKMLLFNINTSPFTSIILILEAIISGIVPTLQIIVLADFMNQALVIAGNKELLYTIIPTTLLVVFVVGYRIIIKTVTHLVKTKHSMNIQKMFNMDAIEKTAALEYHHIETPETMDLISRVTMEGYKKTMDTFYAVINAAVLITRIAGIIGILLVNMWFASIGILIFAIPLFALAMKAGKEVYDAEVEVARAKRLYEYFSELITGREAVDERTLFGFVEKINGKWMDQYDGYRRVMNKANVKNNIRLEGGSIITGIITIIAIVFLMTSLFTGHLSSGIFISLVIAIIQLIEIMSWSFTDIVSRITNAKIFAKDITQFFALNEKEGAVSLPRTPPIPFESLEFRNVRFRYAENLPYILDGISFIIKPHKHYAFVGINGAGKTTIIKLIAGLYDHYEGEILLNGMDLKSYSAEDIKSLVSVAFQDYAKYDITLEENISIGALNGSSTHIMDAVRTMGLENVISRLPDGIKSVLGRLKEGGQDLSGGEWQRVAMARNIMGRSSITILDEPTAALDPIAENKVYKEFEAISRDRTTIFISHRLGSTKLADVIYVIENGIVVESGSHDELLASQGIYSAMYEGQKRWYD